MIEERENRIPLHQRVLVKELDTFGFIYESAVAWNAPDTIYGVQLDKTVWAGGLCTEVWHCSREGLQVIT